MTLDKLLRVGETVRLGAHTFRADEIKAFAAKYDPQPFHMDEDAARASPYGRLCASGWHTVAIWMHFNVANYSSPREVAHLSRKPGVELGPSPGLRNLKWLKPVYAGDTITYTRTVVAHRKLSNRPGWGLMTNHCEGFNHDSDKVLEFESAALFRSPASQ